MAMLPRTAIGLFCGIVDAAIVVVGLKYPALNWIVDGPGWTVGRFMSVNFHEGEVALGFFLAIVLSWICASLFVFGGVRLAARGVRCCRAR
jgi:hypothetical protein